MNDHHDLPHHQDQRVQHDDEAIRLQVLHGLALNRTPGLHYAGNFLDISFDEVTTEGSQLSLDPGPHCVDADGQVSLGPIALLADIALSSSVRAQLHRAARLATVGMTLQLNGLPRTGRIIARAQFEGFFANGVGRLGTTRVALSSAPIEDGAGGVGPERILGFGTGAFMAIPPPKNVQLHPVPLRKRYDPPVPAVSEDELRGDEIAIWQSATTAVRDTARKSITFVDAFWGIRPRSTKGGAACSVKSAPQIGNRVGHTQGGILVGIAAATANAALPVSWQLGAITASFVSPGEGDVLRARSKIVHRGRLTAVVHTQIVRPDRRVVLDVVSNHLACAAGTG